MFNIKCNEILFKTKSSINCTIRSWDNDGVNKVKVTLIFAI